MNASNSSNTPSELPASAEPASSQPPGISGPKVTIWVLGLLIGLGGTLVFALASYSQLEAVRREGIEAWADCREPLAARYREIEQVVARKVDDEEVAIAWAEKFRLATDRFRTTAQPKEQLAASRRVESLLSDPAAASCVAPVSAPLQATIDTYNARLADETEQLRSLGCRLLDIFLELPPPEPLKLTQPPA